MSKTRYSAFKVLKEALTGHKGWEPTWRDAEPKADGYDVIIIGGGGHGLATAYYLAKNHGITNVAVLERGWIGSGNVGRNTTIIRSNYLLPGNEPFYELSLQLWENLEQDLNYNTMVSQRGIMNLIHSDAQRDAFIRRGNSMLFADAGCEYLEAKEVKERYPFLDMNNARFPIKAALAQPRGGTVRHDAVAWGYARGADEMGVDIIQNCEVKGIKRNGDSVEGLETTKGFIKTKKIGVVAAGHSSVIANMAGLKLPLESKPLQALVSEPVKPIIDTVVMSNAVHAYVSQSDKGELVIGAGTDDYVSYSQKGSHDIVEGTLNAILELYPIFSRMRMLRQWGGIVDICPDASPIISKTSIKGLYFNCGWGTGGFKATPGSGDLFAHTIANDEPHKLNAAFNINRFVSGDLVDEHGAAAVAH